MTHETYFHKRPAFKHEREVRLLIADNRLYIRKSISRTYRSEIISLAVSKCIVQRRIQFRIQL